MKFAQLSAFEKHLEKASPNHLSRIYLAVTACGCERRQIFELITSAIHKKEGSVALFKFDGKEVEWSVVREELDTFTCLGGYRVVALDEIDKLKKSALLSLCAYVSQPSSSVYVILGANTRKKSR